MVASAKGLGLLTPAFTLRVNGKDISREERAFLLTAKYMDDVEGLDMAEFVVDVFDAPRNRFRWLESGPFNLGSEIQLKMGFGTELAEMMTGEITALVPNFSINSARTMRIRMYDKAHRLTQGKKVRNFTGLRDSEIVRKIARENGLRASVRDTGTVIPQVIQNNLSDMEFVRQRARRYGFEAFVRGDELFFQPSRENTSAVTRLVFSVDFPEFQPTLSLSEPVTEVEVRGWDSNNKQEIRGRAARGSEITRMKGSVTASDLTTRVFGQQKIVVTNLNVYNASQSDRFAASILKDHSNSLLRGQLKIMGNAALKAGRVVELTGMSKSYNGNYYIESSTHVIDKMGYNTLLNLRRNSV